MIEREIQKLIENQSGKGKAIVILGARQTGKTTLLKKMFYGKENVLWLNCDEPEVRSSLENVSSSRLRSIIGDNKIVVIDEAQRIEDIGLKLKLITDEIKEVQIVATGSSSFELANKLNEPLTGRKREYKIFPLSFAEMSAHNGLINEIGLLNHRLVFGCYPEVVSCAGSEKEILEELINSYLYKDLLIWGKLKKADTIIKLLQALAFQIGSEVSYSELGNLIGSDKQTVEKYIGLLENCFVIFRLGAFSRNLRKEIAKSKKIYFYDVGIRNALINNFASLELRQDKGALWENYIISERIKYTNYNSIKVNRYFWRTYDQQEIDYIEEADGKLSAYEFKWISKAKNKIPDIFIKEYDVVEAKIISKDNFEEFICDGTWRI